MNNEIDDSDKLKPCPFCGGDAEIITLEGGDGDVNAGAMCVQCPSCGSASSLVYPLMDDVKDLLLERWNKRASRAAIAPAVPPGWQPIETAPLNDKVLGACDQGIFTIKWRDYCRCNQPKFTHWQPLPQPPQGGPHAE